MGLKNVILWPQHSAVSLYRIAYKCRHGGRLARVLAVLFYRLNVMLNGADITPDSTIGENLSLIHSIGVVIGACTIGDNVTIFQNVTLGKRYAGANDGFPVIEDGVTIFAGAAVIGPITIGKGARIGANAVVLSDVPANALAVGNPARIVQA